jgi:hypothetical protein
MMKIIEALISIALGVIFFFRATPDATEVICGFSFKKDTKTVLGIFS